MTGFGTAAQTVVDGLFTTLTGFDEDTSVLDYALAGRMPKEQYLIVGEAITATKIGPQALGARYGMHAEIRCLLVCTSGSSAVQPRAANAAALLDKVEAAILAEPTLGGVTYCATLGEDADWSTLSDQNGSAVEVGFTVVAQRDVN